VASHVDATAGKPLHQWLSVETLMLQVWCDAIRGVVRWCNGTNAIAPIVVVGRDADAML